MADIDIQAQIATSWEAAQQPLASRTIALKGAITEETANDTIAHLLLLDRLSHAPIVLRFNSTGGQVYGGLALYDTMQHIKAPVITVADVLCAGVALHLLVAGTKRYALPSSQLTYVPLHPTADGRASDIIIAKNEILRLADIMAGVVLRHTDRRGWFGRMLSAPKPAWDMNQRRTFTPDEAVTLNIVDEIIPSGDAVPR